MFCIILLHDPSWYTEHVFYRSRNTDFLLGSPTSINQALNSPEGINCFGNERAFLQDQAKLCNNKKLSDITLVVGGKRYYAHKVILISTSEVFERMLLGEWVDSNTKVTEIKHCQNVIYITHTR